MKKQLTRLLALALSLTMVFDTTLVTALAAEEPQVPLPETITAPEALQGGDYFFFTESDYAIGEKSSEKLYIPIGRTGDLSQEAQVTLKLVDMTTHFGVNYTAEILGEDVEPFARYGHVSMVDAMVDSADNMEDFYEYSDDELAQIIYDQGGADITVGDEVVGRVTTEPAEDAAAEPAEKSEAEAEAEAKEEAKEASAPTLTKVNNPLKAGRNQFTGVVSDRPGAPAEEELPAQAQPVKEEPAQEQPAEEEPVTLENEFPGTEYTLTFAPDEQVKYLVLTPKYSAKAEGDSVLILSLQNPTAGVQVEENTLMANVVITDEDEPETVTLSMATPTISVSGDVATIEVTRTGGINNMVYATIFTAAGTAETGKDFSGMSAKLYFPFGVTKRTVELPVGHADEDLYFHVWLGEPVGCELGEESTRVILTARENDATQAELQSDEVALQSDDVDYSAAYGGNESMANAFGGAYVMDAAIDLSNATKQNQATVSGTTATLSGVGEDDDITNSIRISIPYALYDGVRVDWEQDYSGFFAGCTSGMAWITANDNFHVTYDNTFHRIDDFFFTVPEGRGYVWIANQTNSGYGRVAKVNSVKYIKRDFTFKLEPAATPEQGGLTFANCTPAEIASYQTAVLKNSADPTKKTIQSLDSISLSANSTNEYVRLAGLEAKKSNGSWYRLATFGGTSRTATITADADTIYSLWANNAITWDETTTNIASGEQGRGRNKSFSGTITIRPVFEYIDVKVTVNPGEEGNFNANITDPSATGQITETTTLQNVHMGDRLYLTGTAAKPEDKTPLGYDIVQRDDNGTLARSSTEEYVQAANGVKFDKLLINKKTTILTPVFTDRNNSVQVAIPMEMVSQLKSLTDAAGNPVNLNGGKLDSNGNRVYTLSGNIKSLDQIVALKAEPKNAGHVLLWQETGSTTQYSGNTFYYQAKATAEKNVLSLTVDTAGGQYYSLSGTAIAQVMNLATGRSTGVESAENAYITADGIYTGSGSDGTFTMNPVYGKEGTKVRFLTEFNGATGVHEATLTGTATDTEKLWYAENGTLQSRDVTAVQVSLGNVELPAFSDRSAHVVSVAVYQDNHLVSGGETIALSGAPTRIVITTKDAESYTDYSGNVVPAEQVTSIGLVFVDPYTGEPHGQGLEYTECVEGPAPSNSTGEPKIYYQRGADGYTTWTLPFVQGDFVPGGEKFTYGDILYVALQTDKQIGSHFETEINDDTGESSSQEVKDYMSYNPMSTGYGVVASDDVQYKEMSLPDVTSLLSAANFTGGASAGKDGATEASYGEFPFLGSIELGLKTFFVLRDLYKSVNDDTDLSAMLDEMEESMDEEGELESVLEGYGELTDVPGTSLMYVNESEPQAELQAPSLFERLYKKTSGKGAVVRIDVVMRVKELPHGGVRLMIGAGATTGMDIGSQSNNWSGSANRWKNAKTAQTLLGGSYFNLKNYGSTGAKSNNKAFTGASLTFSLMIGVALDWVDVHITKKDADGNVTDSSENIYLVGAGMFVGGAVCFNATLSGSLGPIPCYCGLKVYGSVSTFLMDSGDLKENLEYAVADADAAGGQQSLVLDNGWTWDMDFYASIYAGGYVGVGFYGAVGIRADVGVQLDFAKSPKTTAFFEGVSDNYGVNLLLKLSGTIDLWIASIPLGEYSVPLDAWGFYEYFNEVKKSNRLIKYLDDNFAEPWFNGNKGDHPQDSPYYAEVLAKRDALYDLVYSYKATPTQLRNATDELRTLAYEKGFISSWQNWCASTSATVSVGGVNLMSEDPDYFIRQPVDSEWVANDIRLFSTYGNGQESAIQKNAYAQPEAQLIDIGNGKMLMVFLASNADNGTNFQTELQYAVYNSANGSWSAPAAVPGGVKGAMTPSVCDAGDDVLITWVGLGAEDLENQNLRNTVNPVNLLKQMEVYSIRYNKADGTFGEIDRLTKDEFYDNSPHAVYDEITEDVIVLYTKTAPDTEYDYENRAVSDQLLDFANPYGVTLDEEGNLVGSKTYSVICYMSYNASKDDDGETGTHTGWQFDSYYSTELTAEDFESEEAFKEYVRTWKGQRFLPSSVAGIKDPPIADLTVCSGYNGLASYAYTVDIDNNLTTTDDRELILQFYNFKDHKTYVPIRLTYDDLYQNQPQLVRNEENTWLFFIEDAEQDNNNRDLMYLNVSDLLKGTYKEDGTLDSDSLIINPDGTLNGSSSYKIQPLKVDTAGYSDDGTVAGINSYQVFTDEEDNLYVTWLSPAADVEDDYAAETEREQTTTGVEVYATAKVKESLKVTDTSPHSDGQMPQTQTVSAWSKPVQLTNTGKKNDGVTAAVGPDNDLFLVYNQYEMKYNEQEGGLETSPITLMSNKLTKQGSLEVAEFQFSDLTPQPNDTVTVTAILENAGLTAVQGFSLKFYARGKAGNKTPIKISDGSDPYTFDTDETVYVNSTKAFTFTWKAPADIADLDGMTIVCEAAEKKPGGGSYDAVVSTSDPFTVTSEPIVVINSIEQRGDQFYVTYTVGNVGNEATSEETTADITVTGLYSKSRTALKKEYGKDQDIVIRSVNVGSIEPNTKKTFSKFVKLPASLFDVCGFDELKVSLMSDDENNPDRETLFTSNGVEVIQTEPINVQLNGGNRIYLTQGTSKTISCTADGNANKWMFDPQKDVVYTSSDPSVVTVSETGVLTAVGTGTATITATVLPYGTSAQADVTVSSYTPSEPDDDEPTTPSKPATVPENITAAKAENGSVTVTAANSAGKATTTPAKGDTVTVAAKPEKGYSVAQIIVRDAAGKRILVDIAKDGYTFEMPDGKASVEVVFQKGSGDFADVPENSYYSSAVQWAAVNGITAGVGDNLFQPAQDCTRAQIVTFLWRAAGCPKPESQNNPFSDVQAGAYYSDAVLWAIENGITNGTSATAFSPDKTCNRGEAVTFLHRLQNKQAAQTQNSFLDVAQNTWYTSAVDWALENGITNGTSDTMFSPNLNCQRSQIVTFLYRCLSK